MTLHSDVEVEKPDLDNIEERVRESRRELDKYSPEELLGAVANLSRMPTHRTPRPEQDPLASTKTKKERSKAKSKRKAQKKSRKANR